MERLSLSARPGQEACRTPGTSWALQASQVSSSRAPLSATTRACCRVGILKT